MKEKVPLPFLQHLGVLPRLLSWSWTAASLLDCIQMTLYQTLGWAATLFPKSTKFAACTTLGRG